MKKVAKVIVSIEAGKTCVKMIAARLLTVFVMAALASALRVGKLAPSSTCFMLCEWRLRGGSPFCSLSGLNVQGQTSDPNTVKVIYLCLDHNPLTPLDT